jgi:hypothetical protein
VKCDDNADPAQYRFGRQAPAMAGACYIVHRPVLRAGGTINPLPVFLTPLVKQYGWSHARVSWVPTVYLLMFGLGAPVIGSSQPDVRALCSEVVSSLQYEFLFALEEMMEEERKSRATQYWSTWEIAS